MRLQSPSSHYSRCARVFYDAFGRVLIFMWESVYLAGFSVGGLLRSVNAVPMCRIYELNCLFYDCSSFDAPQSPSPSPLPQPVNNKRRHKHFMCTTKCMKCTANSKVPGGGRCSRGGAARESVIPFNYSPLSLSLCLSLPAKCKQLKAKANVLRLYMHLGTRLACHTNTSQPTLPYPTLPYRTATPIVGYA